MKRLKLLVLGVLIATPAARAAYAPIPQNELGDAFTATLRASVTSDSNIFGAQNTEIDSTVYSISPKLAVNSSISSQTFVSGSYQLTIDRYDNRPGKKTLDSHQLMGRVAHQFNEASSIDITDLFMAEHNPQSLLAGLPINSDQSFKRNEFNVTYGTAVGPKTGIKIKGRNLLFRYNSSVLSAALDRSENLFGVSADYAFLPELKLNGEYRYQTIGYRTGGSFKDKDSHFFLVGADYAVAEKVSATARVGVEDRNRDNAPGITAPYVELTGKYDYARGSFLSGGYGLNYEEASNVVLFTDTEVNRYFVNVQHAISPLITGSASVTYESSRLKGRFAIPSIDDSTWRYGLALTYQATGSLSLSVTYDRDDVSSDDVAREMKRNRFGASGTFTF